MTQIRNKSTLLAANCGHTVANYRYLKQNLRQNASDLINSTDCERALRWIKVQRCDLRLLWEDQMISGSLSLFLFYLCSHA